MIFDKLFQLMAEKQASDLYVSAGTPIHMKVEGITVPINQQIMEPGMIRKMAEELLNAEQFARFDSEREFNTSCGSAELGNFRINLFWQRHSIAIVVRYIPTNIPTIETLGLPASLADVVLEKNGLVLVVGSTGSGKSTTLASMVEHRNQNKTGHILTVEDPIEFLFQHGKSVVNQREIGVDTHDWGEALRNPMRQAPDCILIGEIRDRETMQAALAYSQTGHLCLGTLHANNAYHALNRIVNFFPLDNRSLLHLDLAVALRCIVSQRLVRGPDGERMPAVEVLMNSRHIAELIEAGDFNAVKEAMEQSLSPGSQTFEQDLYRMYRDQSITLNEALDNADSATNLHWIINNSDSRTASQRASAPTAVASETPFSSFALNTEES